MKEVLHTDNFAADVDIIRDLVIKGGFSTETGPDGAVYTGICTRQVPHWCGIISRLRGAPIVPKLSCFRINYEGELPHSWVHSDDICAKWASVLYLNTPDQCKGGTAFWKHKGLGIDRLPTPEFLKEAGAVVDDFYGHMTEDWKNLDVWEQVGMIPMQYNRFITYPTCLFHSRFPFEGFGSTPEDGRLIWICFYDLPEGAS